ncbi:hypothetical protein CW304_17785 [Bacillus sp. UFRGS-B20]|nr:hypothetical protein CW304_17785 [Bacillus sp. UFRGS-B20]
MFALEVRPLIIFCLIRTSGLYIHTGRLSTSRTKSFLFRMQVLDLNSHGTQRAFVSFLPLANA